MFNVDPGDYYLSALGAGTEDERARADANQLMAQQAMQAGHITRDQYGEFLIMPHAEQTKFVAGLAPNFIDQWKQGELRARQLFAGINPSSWASGIFGEPIRDPKTGAWGTRDVQGSFGAFTPAPTPTPTPGQGSVSDIWNRVFGSSATPTPGMPISSGTSPLDKILAPIFGAFGAPSPLASPATPTPTPTPTATPTPQPTPTARSVLVKFPEGVIRPVPIDDFLPNILAQGGTLVF